MTRVKYHPGEVDQNFQIEDGIRQTLGKSPTAEVSASVIQSCYDLLDEKWDPIKGTLGDKCIAIAKIVGADFSLVGKDVVFTNKSGIARRTPTMPIPRSTETQSVKESREAKILQQFLKEQMGYEILAMEMM